MQEGIEEKKGSGFAQRLVELCSDHDLPDIVVKALERVSADLPNDLSTDDDDGGEGDVDDDDAEVTALVDQS